MQHPTEHHYVLDLTRAPLLEADMDGKDYQLVSTVVGLQKMGFQTVQVFVHTVTEISR